jgi:2',3'-cyclic-nucleotide 2'-phosphodiesterase / 3'-nucleotidase
MSMIQLFYSVIRRKSWFIFILILMLITVFPSCSGKIGIKINILETTDVHGVIFPFDFVENKPISSSLASLSTLINELRLMDENILLLDNGDILQGQPAVYYYNFVDTISPHICSSVMNYLQYDAATTGNHDLEAGHDVYDRLIKEYNFPVLAANAVSISTGEPYFKPYVIIKKAGLKIAVFGLITPGVPNMLPPELYSGIEFRGMVETAKKWMPEIRKEKPDIIIGLFHAGWDDTYGGSDPDDPMNENGSRAVAYNVPGFDIVFTGHDHNDFNSKMINIQGDSVLVLNAGSRAEKVAIAELIISKNKVNGVRQRSITGKLVNLSEFDSDIQYLEKFKSQYDTVLNYINRVIGESRSTISSRESYFGPSAFIDMIHSMQLKITGADVSFAAPLSFDVEIKKGPVRVNDMFKLYRFENMLYTMNLTGKEIDGYLEYSYGGWLNTMKTPDDLLLMGSIRKSGNSEMLWLKNQPYNFDSAAGIIYTVDVRKPEGERINIFSLVNGKPFYADSMYTVALNSYRGNGGGGHLAEGAGLSREEMSSRLISSTKRDLRYYIIETIENEKIIDPAPSNNWKIIPEDWVARARKKEYPLLFGSAN